MKHLLTLFTLLLIITSCGGKGTETITEYRNCKEFRSKWTQRDKEITIDLTEAQFDEDIPISILGSLNGDAVVCTYNLRFSPVGNEFQGGMTVSYRPVYRGWSGNLSTAEVSYCKKAEAKLSFELKCNNLVTCDKDEPSQCKTYEVKNN